MKKESFNMKKVILRSSGIRIYLIITLLLLFVLRLAIPQYVKYLLFPLLAVSGIFAFVQLVKSWPCDRLRNMRSVFLPLVLISLFYLIAFIMTTVKQNMLFRDFVNVSAVFVLFFVILVLINSKKELTSILSRFRNYVVIASTIVAGLGLVKLYYQLLGIKFGFLEVEGIGYPNGTSLSVDSNFFTLVCIFGIIFSLPLLLKKNPFYIWVLIQLSLVVLLFNIFLSTSRRGIIIASAVLVGFIIVWGLSVILKDEKLKQFRKNSLGFGMVSLFLISTIFYLLLFVSSFERNKRLSFSKFNQLEVHHYVNMMTVSTESIFKSETDYHDVSSRNWQSNFDSRYPYSGWATGNYTPVNELTGENVGIVPKSAVGAKIDKTAGGSTRNSNANYVSKFFERNVEMRKRYLASVYCYVSPDFNGDWVRISSNGNVKGLTDDYYDLSQKGKWQKLVSSYNAESGRFSTYLYLSKLNAASLDSLNGYVVFAYPELKEISFDPKLPITWAGSQFDEVSHLPGFNADIVPAGTVGYQLNNTANGNIYKKIFRSSTDYQSIPVASGDSIYASVFCYVSKDFNGNAVRLQIKGNIERNSISRYDINNKGKWVKLEVKGQAIEEGLTKGVLFFSKSDVTDFSTLKGSVTFAYPIIKVVKPGRREISYNVNTHQEDIQRIEKATLFSLWQVSSNSNISDQDSIEVIPEFQREMVNNSFAGPRLNRWRYALHLYINEYNFSQKLIGAGFGYTRKFARMFFKEERDFDYPHNPFLSVLLYSGLIGLIAYLLFIYKVINYYWKYRREYWPFALCFAAAFFFAFFSANSPFDPAILGVLSILPYIIHYNHLKGEEDNERS